MEADLTPEQRDRLITAYPELLYDFGYRDDCGCMVWYGGGADPCWRHRLTGWALRVVGFLLRWRGAA